ncbi:ANTAR domain-containing protein [Nocardia sp. BSTN01]|uniref:PAS and ANTAR domain-containing protein n=1 Tax=Nocardia sp. BSTN01 TaxID=2783665 RepID=UPI00188EF8BF|nr:PAS and ANTAR domain-containing protein [Nocardia sp. BSTN01]MBF4998202.1 ANTAR domain-containing protein [Nocardia sp. BSTN01]
MVASGDDDGVERVVGAGDPQGVGRFRFWFAEGRWEWSDEVARMHGYAPGQIEPTTELLLEHKHPDDRDRVEATLVTSVEDHAPFSSRHRIVDTDGTVRDVLVVSEPMLDASGEVIGTQGYYVDLTDSVDRQRRALLDEELPAVIERRAAIEQAKGILMFVYRISAEQAFRVLAWRSQETNVKLQELAAQLVGGLDTMPAVPAPTRTRLDHLLLTLRQPDTDEE